MPTYRFQCNGCGLNFTARAAVNTPSVACGACGAAAPRDLPRTVNAGHAGGSAPAGPAPGDSGYAGVDYDVDRAIGEDAAAKWKIVNQRQRDKIDYLQATGSTGFDLSRNLDGTYRVMGQREREVKEKTREEALAAAAKARAQTPASAPPPAPAQKG